MLNNTGSSMNLCNIALVTPAGLPIQNQHEKYPGISFLYFLNRNKYIDGTGYG